MSLLDTAPSPLGGCCRRSDRLPRHCLPTCSRGDEGGAARRLLCSRRVAFLPLSGHASPQMARVLWRPSRPVQVGSPPCKWHTFASKN